MKLHLDLPAEEAMSGRSHDRLDAKTAFLDLACLVKEVISASTLTQALQTVVHHMRKMMNVDVCEIYITDYEMSWHALLATEGLPPELVGHVHFSFGEGLIGRVAEQASPFNLDNATTHPDYVFHLKTGEGRYHGFLGVPLIHQRRVLGVLVVRQRVRRRFHESDVALLVTLAAQLASAVAYAQVTAESVGMPQGHKDMAYLEGQPGAPGVVLGKGLVVFEGMALGTVPDRAPEDVKKEEAAFRTAVDRTVQELSVLSASLGSVVATQCRALFEAYVLLLSSDEMVDATVQRIREGNWAPGALRQVIEEHCSHFDKMEDPYFRERRSDIFALGQRLLDQLVTNQRVRSRYPQQTILVGEQVSAIDLAEVPEGRLVGVVSSQGSKLSHVAILAHARGVPAVMGVGEVSLQRLDGRELVLDGYLGRVYIEPKGSVRQEFVRVKREEQELTEALSLYRNRPAETPDGLRVPLGVNIGSAAEAELAQGVAADSIGLFRTELPFMLHNRFPSEEEQCSLYRQVLKVFAPRMVTIRTLDAGGDKVLPYLPIRENNPFLGWRGMRMTLDHPEIFLGQLRAILRAAVGLGNVQLLFPMINGVAELEEAKRLFEQAYQQLRQEGIAVVRPRIGVMIEVPSAVYQAKELAQRSDFLSVGTNDLTQYLLAVDRTNPRVAKLLEPLHPAVLMALMDIVRAARSVGKPVSVCGELASDPASVLLLLAMGFDGLSMSVGALPRIRCVVCGFTLERMHALLKTALQCDRAESVRKVLHRALEDVGLGGLVRAGK